MCVFEREREKKAICLGDSGVYDNDKVSDVESEWAKGGHKNGTFFRQQMIMRQDNVRLSNKIFVRPR